MPTQETFHERSFKFAVDILGLFRRLKRTTDAPHHFLSQMLRAGTSIGANLEEARSAYSRRDLASKQTIALRETRECRYWLRLIQIDQPSASTDLPRLLAESEQLIRMLTSSVRKLRGHGPQGPSEPP